MSNRYAPGLDSTATLVQQRAEATAKLKSKQKQPADAQVAHSINPDGTVTAYYVQAPRAAKYGRGE